MPLSSGAIAGIVISILIVVSLAIVLPLVLLKPSGTYTCTPSNPTGTCPSGQTCESGVCTTIPIYTCTLSNPTGTCPSGQTCENGICTGAGPTYTCSPSNPTGTCPSGQTCDNGICTVTPPTYTCSPSNPTGTCPSGQTCQDGICTGPGPTYTCSPSNPTGTCPSGQTCQNGQCAPAPTGCGTGPACNSTQTCINNSYCADGYQINYVQQEHGSSPPTGCVVPRDGTGASAVNPQGNCTTAESKWFYDTGQPSGKGQWYNSAFNCYLAPNYSTASPQPNAPCVGTSMICKRTPSDSTYSNNSTWPGQRYGPSIGFTNPGTCQAGADYCIADTGNSGTSVNINQCTPESSGNSIQGLFLTKLT